MNAFTPGSLLAHLARIPDPRSPHGQRFPLTALLAAACAAILCGARSFAAIAQWGRSQDLGLMHRLGFYRRPPTQGAYRYLFLRLDAETLEAVLGGWIAPLVRPEADQLRPTPMDGKTARGSPGPLRSAVHLLSLLDGPTGGVLRQTAVDGKTNEHKAALALLEGLVLEGRLVTADALFCHRDAAERILERGGHYFFAVKDNQETLLKDIQAAFEPAFSPYEEARRRSEDDTASSTDQHGGRVEVRTIRTTPRRNDYLDWPGVGQVRRIERVVKCGGEERRETAYGITSAGPEWAGAAELLACWRGHWGIENRLHGVRDVTLGEDASRLRTEAAPQVMAALRNAAVSLLRLLGATNIAEALRANPYRVPAVLAELGIVNL